MFQLRAFEFVLALALALALAFALRLALAFVLLAFPLLALSPPPQAVARASAAHAKIARSVFLLMSSPVSSYQSLGHPARTRTGAALRPLGRRPREESRWLRWALIWGNLSAGGAGGTREERGLGDGGWGLAA